MDKLLAIGLMSGTSLDGMDACLVKINEVEGYKPCFQVVKFVTLKYEEDFKNKLARNLNNSKAKLAEISGLNFEVGEKSVEAIDLLLKDTPYSYNDIEYVASHGQTIWHDPKGACYPVASTFQIGEPSVINYRTGIKVISNFRSKDVASGGEGAPLVPYALHYLFTSDKENICFQNIGGIANLTYLPTNATLDQVVAFDAGPGNCLIDYFMNKYYGVAYDQDGSIAMSGMVINEVIDYLLNDEYLARPYPKSTGKEKYSKEFADNLAYKFNFDAFAKEDIITTMTEFSVQAMLKGYSQVGKIDKLIVTGGGAHNLYIMHRLASELDCMVLTGGDFGIDSDALEALSFVVLGYNTLHHQASNAPSVTGAKEKVILGSITY